MPVEPRIPTQVTITEVLSQRHYRAALPNGKIIIAHYPVRRLGKQLAVGDQPRVELAVSDFSEGEIVSAAS